MPNDLLSHISCLPSLIAGSLIALQPMEFVELGIRLFDQPLSQ